MVVAAVDAGIDSGRVRRTGDVRRRNRVAEPRLFERADEVAAVIDDRRRLQEMRGAGERRRCSNREHSNSRSQDC
jgi:hypothetical protein